MLVSATTFCITGTGVGIVAVTVPVIGTGVGTVTGTGVEIVAVTVPETGNGLGTLATTVGVLTTEELTVGVFVIPTEPVTVKGLGIVTVATTVAVIVGVGIPFATTVGVFCTILYAGEYWSHPTNPITDGAYFQLDGSTFGVATLKGGVETLVTSGSFNGQYGSTYTLDTIIHTYEIYWTNSKVYFVIDGQILHTVSATSSTWSNTPTLYIWADNVNSGGITTNKSLTIRVQSIYRLGKLESAPTYKHITTATTTVCKYGAGTLHSIIINNPTNNSITIYDNTAGSGTTIAIINPGSAATPVELHYDLDFYTGLSVTTAGTPDLTVVYE